MVEIKKFFPKYTREYRPLSIIYILILLLSGISLVKAIDYPLGKGFIVCFMIIMLGAVCPKLKLKYKYILCVVGFIPLYCTFWCFDLSFDDAGRVAFYLPILYAYVLPDILSPVVFGLLMSQVLIQYMGEYPANQITGYMFGIINTSILYSIVSFLMDRLADSKDSYMNMSLRDSLTNTYNLNHIMKIGEDYLEECKDLMVIILDIDQFKKFNDTYGHLIGNEVLKQVAVRVEERVAQHEGVTGRLGGDEFVALVPNISTVAAKALYEDIKYHVNDAKYVCEAELEPMKLSISVGMAHVADLNTKTIQELLHHADMQMYYHKEICKGITSFVDHDDYLNSQHRYLLDLLFEKDVYSYVHSKYVVQYVSWILEEIKTPKKNRVDICIGAWLHDIGKLYIKDNILRKPCELTDDEYEVIKKHVDAGVCFTERLGLPGVAINVIKYHHECWDGTGYPYGLEGEAIPIEGRIVQVADAFSAITTKRVYRDLMDVEGALNELRVNKGTQFDPEIVEAFARALKKKGVHRN